ncbi:hypothetical protein L1987_20271 [Smallanthus sonchifolius]|uniref:Uncharacterized protein n=1 Tax=Smallanthus sonchifolius TaxID=185202 RepID=A0ACB9IRS9_9ASTR|nr:hypothetical protein L1987_20271 [Smallanthus sonchifolius]
MCEICGGPHLTRRCPYSSGDSTNCYDHFYPQVQPYAEYRTKEELNAWCKEANEQYEKDIQAIIALIGSYRLKNLERVVYDHEGNEIGIENASGELILTTPSLETIMDDVKIIVTEGEAQVPPPSNTGRRYNQEGAEEDGFWSDEEDVIEEEELIEIPKTLTDDECFEEGLAGLFKTEDDSEDEFLVEMIEEEQV